jgi:hypothetical protein
MVALAAAALLATACRKEAASGGATDAGSPLALVEQGRYDEAIAAVGGAGDPDALYVLGRAWAGKAALAPVPAPEPGQSLPPLKPEELNALGFLERAVAARPDHARAHLAIAELLEPHALAALGAQPAGAKGSAASASAGDAEVDRVLRNYAEAMQADPAGTDAAEGLIRFATATGRLVEAGAAYQELLKRRREDPGLLVRYGDFLAGPRREPEAALGQYAQALMWRPDDGATRLKMADIHLQAAADHLARREYVAAEQRIREAKRLGFDPASRESARMSDLERQLRDIRGR